MEIRLVHIQAQVRVWLPLAVQVMAEKVMDARVWTDTTFTEGMMETPSMWTALQLEGSRLKLK